MAPIPITTTTTIPDAYECNCTSLEWVIKIYEQNISSLTKVVEELNKTIHEKDSLIEKVTEELELYKENKYCEEIKNYLYYNITSYFQKTENYFQDFSKILKVEIPICITLSIITLSIILSRIEIVQNIVHKTAKSIKKIIIVNRG